MHPRRLRRLAALVAVLGSVAWAGSAAAASGGPPGGLVEYAGVRARVTPTCATQSVSMSLQPGSPGPAAGDVLRVGFQRAGGETAGVASISRRSSRSGTNVQVASSDAAAPRWFIQAGSQTSPAQLTYPWSCPAYDGEPRSTFLPLAPRRVLDTRPESQVGYGGPKPGPGTTIPVRFDWPPELEGQVTAVALNVTLTEADGPGFVQVFPTGLAEAGSSSNLNASRQGQTIPNSAIVPVGVDDTVSLHTQAGGHLVVDVAGAFVASDGSERAGRFEPSRPHRALDTRGSAAGGLAPGEVRNLPLAGLGPVPAAELIDTVVVNLTATEAAGPGFVQVAPGGQLVPGATSTLNLEQPGQTIANMAIVPLGADGSIDLHSQGGTQLVVDVLGWFTSDAAPASGDGLFVPVVPERVMDSRVGTGVNCCSAQLTRRFEGPRPGGFVDVWFHGLRAEHPIAVVLNVTATDTQQAGFLQTAGRAQWVPGATSTLNIDAPGDTIANLAIVATPNDDVDDSLPPAPAVTIYAEPPMEFVADLAGYFALEQVLTDPS